MAELTSIVYAESLLEVCEDLGITDQTLEELNAVKTIFDENMDFFGFYCSPQVEKEEKKEAIKGVFADQLSPTTMNLLYVLLDKKRPNEFFGIVKQFARLVREKNNEISGIIYLARPCSDDVIDQIKKKLSKATGKNLNLEVNIDPSLVGGIKVKIGDSVVDSTVASRLKDIKGTIENIII